MARTWAGSIGHLLLSVIFEFRSHISWPSALASFNTVFGWRLLYFSSSFHSHPFSILFSTRISFSFLLIVLPVQELIWKESLSSLLSVGWRPFSFLLPGEVLAPLVYLEESYLPDARRQATYTETQDKLLQLQPSFLLPRAGCRENKILERVEQWQSWRVSCALQLDILIPVFKAANLIQRISFEKCEC